VCVQDVLLQDLDEWVGHSSGGSAIGALWIREGGNSVFCKFEGDGLVQVQRVVESGVQSVALKISPEEATVLDLTHFDAVTWTREEVSCVVVSDFVDSGVDEF